MSDITEFMDDFERRTFARIAVMAARWKRDPVDAAVTDMQNIPENLKKTGGNIAAETVGFAGDLQPIAETFSPALKGRKRLPTSEELVERWGDKDHWSSIPAMFAAPGPGEVKAGLLTAKAGLKAMLGLSKEATAGVALATSILGKPIKAYHGTYAEHIDEFDTMSNVHQRVQGAYFTKTEKHAGKYAGLTSPTAKEGGRVIAVDLDLKNPATREVLDEIGYGLRGDEMREELVRRGYDGVVDDLQDEIVAFYPEQITQIPPKPTVADNAPSKLEKAIELVDKY